MLSKYEVNIEADSAQKELTICLISDVHAGSGTWEYSEDDLLEHIHNANPDVLLIAGDTFDETTSERDVENFEWVLEEIEQPKYGIYFVYGNHDGIFGKSEFERINELGVNVLQDEMVVIGEDIQLIGCMDPKYNAKNLDELFKECAPDQDKPILLLTHRPKDFQKMADNGCDLAMAGHTHGFNLPQFMGTPLFGGTFAGLKEYDSRCYTSVLWRCTLCC